MEKKIKFKIISNKTFIKNPFYEIPTQIWQKLTRDLNAISSVRNNGR